MSSNNVALWTPKDAQVIPAGIISPSKLVAYAIQLSNRDRIQIANGFTHGDFEMTMSFVWTKSMAALKRDLAKVGMVFLGELLGRSGFKEDTNPTTSISDEEAISLARQLGVVSATEAMRLRHAHEQISHFVDNDGNELDEDEAMEEDEAILSLRTCVKNILSKQKVEVSTQFAEFRSDLEKKIFSSDDPELQSLVISPYFFRKITLNILLSLARNSKGAQLENALANLNTILPLIWSSLRDAEKWTVGAAYSTAYSDGAQTASAGLKSALLKVKGFDYVPENLRSHTFMKAAEKIIEAHEAMNNFYNEPAPVRELLSMGSTIPIPAFPACASALLCVKLGNAYGVSTRAQTDADTIISSFSMDRWQYFFDECLPGDSRLIGKLNYEKPRENFIHLVERWGLSSLDVKTNARRLIDAAAQKNHKGLLRAVGTLTKEFYGTD